MDNSLAEVKNGDSDKALMESTYKTAIESRNINALIALRNIIPVDIRKFIASGCLGLALSLDMNLAEWIAEWMKTEFPKKPAS